MTVHWEWHTEKSEGWFYLWPWPPFLQHQNDRWAIGIMLDAGIWWRRAKHNHAGYWITWSTVQRFGERFEYERPLWQIGRGVHWRLACFKLKMTNVTKKHTG